MLKPSSSRITCYFDVASAHSWFAFEELTRFRQRSNTSVKFVPIHIASIMNTIGHKNPYYEKALRDYNFYEIKTLGKVYDCDIVVPEEAFEKLSNTGTFFIQRFLTTLQEFQPEIYETICRKAFERLWSKNQTVHSQDDLLELCSSMTIDNEIFKHHSDDKWTLKLIENNQKAMTLKCFGVPWISVYNNSIDQEENFFGADRLPLVYRFLELKEKRSLTS